MNSLRTLNTGLQYIDSAEEFDNDFRKLSFPRKKDYTSYIFYKGGFVLGTSQDPDAYPEAGAKEKFFEEKLFQKDLDEAHRLMSLIDHRFKEWLFQTLKISDNPKKEILYRIAYERGHSSGFREVYNEALDLVELIV
jgi:hypothetical protein